MLQRYHTTFIVRRKIIEAMQDNSNHKTHQLNVNEISQCRKRYKTKIQVELLQVFSNVHLSHTFQG